MQEIFAYKVTGLSLGSSVRPIITIYPKGLVHLGKEGGSLQDLAFLGLLGICCWVFPSPLKFCFS